MRVNKQILPGILAALLMTTIAPTVAAQESQTLAEAISSGTAHLGFRYRLENVDQQGIADEALASTLRTRLNYLTGTVAGLSAFVEIDSVLNVTQDRFNSTRNGRINYPVVADPHGAGVNQFYLKYKTEGVDVTFGRQRINLGNQRFIGGVGWRQNEQTYDAVTLAFEPLADMGISYSYINRVSRVFGPESGTPTPTFDSNSHLLNMDQDLGSIGKVSAYGYFLDLENSAAASNRTVGVRYTNTFVTAMDGVKVPVVFEFAQQNDYADNPVNYSARYWLAQVGLDLKKVQFVLADEVLDGDASAGVAFTTPLATLHGFQGWADKFLATPAAGIDDKSITVKGKVADVAVALAWHNFDSAIGSVSYGSEWDVSAGYKFSKHVDVLLKYASYDADALSTDTKKLWLMVSAQF